MPVQEKSKPLIASVHDKGHGRGLSIYLGSKEVNILEKKGVNIRDEKKYLVKPGRRNEVNLIPISSLEKEEDNLNLLFELTTQINRLNELRKEDKEEFCEDILSILISNPIDANVRESSDHAIY